MKTNEANLGRTSQRRLARVSGALVLTSVAFLAGCGSSSKASSVTTGKAQNSSPYTCTVGINNGPGAAVQLKGSNHLETEQFGAHTFADCLHVSEYGPRLLIGAQVEVDCLATGPFLAAPSAFGKWYHIESPALYAGYYAAANTFDNGNTTAPVWEQPAADPNVPACPA